jgi:MtN3 and saliva related transmembrane protein
MNLFQFLKGGLVLHFTESLGLVAGALVTFSLIPQLIRVLKLKSAHEISLLFTTLLLLGMALWLVYGIYLSLNPVIIWNAIGIALVSLLLYAKLRYGK